ncbi:related to ferroportin 1 [Melanopsichium pennsylvanicum]|uniref:Solute carrier family 40 member n=2 Tax=Melanopsichium pennsylvanicum TaxID=63383 RepID=A0AAJ4XIQ8_9BASI|nr:related to ferroportin 1 [Melanopsichium pennsylvanicum 4]SNX82863.1 related to ferroportin 1 [Melanopsichium pennsylvanicum]
MSRTATATTIEGNHEINDGDSIALEPLGRLERTTSRTSTAKCRDGHTNPGTNVSNHLEKQQPKVMGAEEGVDGADNSFGAVSAAGPSDLDGRGTLLLAIQHASSSWGYRSAEFAYPLMMVQLFTGTLLPASIYGFVTTAGAILFSNNVGRLIDTGAHTKLRTLRGMILSQKLLVGASYALFIVLFSCSSLIREAENGGKGSQDAKANVRPWAIFATITLLGIGVVLSNIGVSVGVEREWVTIISDGSSARLTRLNAIMRRIDLISKLVSPLFVSALTSTISYKLASVILLTVNAVTGIFELIFVGIVYRRFPSLAADEKAAITRKQAAAENRSWRSGSNEQLSSAENKGQGRLTRLSRKVAKSVAEDVKQQYRDWILFVRLPIFLTSVCISLLYMSVLSFDPTFIAYLKSETLYSDAFIAGMRAAGVVAGLIGTFVMPILERRIGLVRTGSYSLFGELIPLIPAVVSFWITGSPTDHLGLSDKHRPSWNTGLLFSGLALSRIGLWSFDLTQLAMIQTALSPEQLGPDASRKNALMALQFSLQNVFDLGHYGLTLGWNKPQEFKYAATVSLAAVGAATVIYLVFYARRVRGHIVHLEGLQRLLSRKER